MRRLLPIVALLALVAVVAIGLVQAGDQTGTSGQPEPARFDLRAALNRLDGAPQPLAGLHGQANQLLASTPSAFERRLRELRGHPVVVNKWASWCGPCRHEFPFFQQASVAHGDEVAFLGLNSGDSRTEAREFLREQPVPYPSYEDPQEEIARTVGAPAAYPITVFYDERGEQAFIRRGGYASREKLERDIARYLGVR